MDRGKRDIEMSPQFGFNCVTPKPHNGRLTMISPFQVTLSVLEAICIWRPRAWVSKPLPHWLLWIMPSLALRPEQKYSFRLYIRMVTSSLLVFIATAGLVLCASSAFFWVQYHDLFQNSNPKVHARVIGVLSQNHFYQLPLALVVIALVLSLISIPEYYFWNRRAKRIENKGVASQASAAEALGADNTVWPPPIIASRGQAEEADKTSWRGAAR